MIQQAQHLLLNDTINFYNVHKYLLSSDLNPWEKKEWIAGIRGEWTDVVLSRIAFGILRTNRVPPDIFRHFWQFFTDFSTFRHFPTFLTVFHGFLHFPPFTAHFCGKHHDFFAYTALQLKIVMLTTKMCGERRKEEKSVKNCQKLSENVGWYPIGT